MAIHAVIYALAFATSAAMGFTTFSLLTHLLAPAQYGIYSTSVSLSFFASSFFFGWIRFSAGRFEAERDGAVNLRFWLVCYIAAAAVAIIAFVIASPYIENHQITLFSLLALTSAQGLFDLSLELRRARRSSTRFAIYNILRSSISLATAVLLALYFPFATYLLFGLAGSFFLCALLNLWGLSTREGPAAQTHDLKHILTFGTGLAISGLVFSSMSVISRLLVAAMVGGDQIGPYNAAADLAAQIGGVVSVSVYSIAGPSVIKTFANSGVASAQEQMKKGGELLLAVLVPATAGLIIVSAPFVTLVTGPAFHKATSELLPLMILQVSISSFSQFYLHMPFQLTSNTRLQVASGVVQVFFVVVTSYLLIGVQGVYGGALALVVSSIVGMVATYLFARSVFPVPIPVAAALKIAVCTCGMAVIAIACMHAMDADISKLIAAVLFGGLTYVALAIAFNVFRSREISWRIWTRLAEMARQMRY